MIVLSCYFVLVFNFNKKSFNYSFKNIFIKTSFFFNDCTVEKAMLKDWYMRLEGGKVFFYRQKKDFVFFWLRNLFIEKNC